MAFNKSYKAPTWAVSQLWRETGLLEDTCKHGVGHPNTVWLKKHDPTGLKCFSIHGCDGCCCGQKLDVYSN